MHLQTNAKANESMQRTDALTALKATGVRLTPQRVMILQALAGTAGHLTAEEIHSQVAETFPFMDLATVYRSLQLFKKLRLVTEIDLRDASAQYEFAVGTRHHHLICKRCGATSDLPPSYLDELRTSLRNEFSFEPDLDHFAVGGVCAGCESIATTA